MGRDAEEGEGEGGGEGGERPEWKKDVRWASLAQRESSWGPTPARETCYRWAAMISRNIMWFGVEVDAGEVGNGSHAAQGGMEHYKDTLNAHMLKQRTYVWLRPTGRGDAALSYSVWSGERAQTVGR